MLAKGRAMVVSTSIIVMVATISTRVKPRPAGRVLTRFLTKRIITVGVAFPEKEARVRESLGGVQGVQQRLELNCLKQAAPAPESLRIPQKNPAAEQPAESA